MSDVRAAAETVWHFMQLRQPIAKTYDLLLVLGSYDTRVASYAGQLIKQEIAPIIIFSGGIAHRNDMLATEWEGMTEAEKFCEVAEEVFGDTGSQIILENAAANTGQNITLSLPLLAEIGAKPRRWLLLTKPYMERRAIATAEAQGPSWAEYQVNSFTYSLDEYCDGGRYSFERVINIMLGDFQRIVEYPKKGFQTEQDIPADVMAAFDKLVASGYTSHLLAA